MFNVIDVRYCTNYNGCHVEAIDGQSEFDSKLADDVADTIVDALADECTDDGEYDYIDASAKESVIGAVRNKYGHHVEVNVTLDHVSY